MILSPQHFVFIHMPKTGGTFVDTCFAKLNSKYLERRKLTHWFPWGKKYVFMRIKGVSKHAHVTEIPNKLRKLPIVGCIRDPIQWYHSNYCFAWWRRYPHKYPGLLELDGFPNLPFSKYLELSNTKWLENDLSGLSCNPNTGRYTALLVKWFSPDPIRFFTRLTGQITVGDLIDEIGHVQWLRTGHLNNDLHALLAKNGHSHDDIRFILDEKPRLPNKDPRMELGPGELVSCEMNDENRSIIRSKDEAAFDFMEYLDAERT